MEKKGRVSRKQSFLRAYESSAIVTRAAKAAGMDPRQHYRWLKEDAKYAAAFEKSQDIAAQLLEDEAVRRAREGTLEPVFYQGEECGVILRYADGLMQFLLRGFRPDKYRERIEHLGRDGGPIELKPCLPEWLQQALQQQSKPPGDTSPS